MMKDENARELTDPYSRSESLSGRRIKGFAGRLLPAVWEEHYHSEVQISTVGAGSATAAKAHDAGGRNRFADLRPEHISIVPSGQPHTIDWRTPANVRTIYVPPQLLDRWAGETGPIEIGCHFNAADRLLIELIDVLFRAVDDPDTSLYLDAVEWTLLGHIATHYSLGGELVSEPNVARLSRSALEQVVRFMHDNISSRISLEDIAVQARLSPYYFSRRFRAATGQSPYQFLLRIRMVRATELLLERRELPLVQVAELCGYTSQSRFSDNFKRHHGMTPAIYRRERLRK